MKTYIAFLESRVRALRSALRLVTREMYVVPASDKVSIDMNYTISLAHPLKLVNLLDKTFEGIKVNQEKIPGSRTVGGCRHCWMLQNV